MQRACDSDASPATAATAHSSAEDQELSVTLRRRPRARRPQESHPPHLGPRLPSRELGRRGEEAAAYYLGQRGYEVLERNWSCPAGEADIIAFDEAEEMVVFVEVKTRTDIAKGLPEEAVVHSKRRRYERIAAYYLRDVMEPRSECRVRFDVISLLVVGSNRALVRHHIDAFSSPE
ncbi:YraN family protein [Eggerthellaceae bacterium zg-1084]|uniref:UPF0102 protein HLV38_00785 n=2 Tax=Berryella wangjianweii TaxID=2734634 RepID=A0A6M8IYG5_9ACTN|nr:YraN family protein [Berryella wangjianweii]NPD32419.1 YraN family protein [Eggerthellaceae bacterium zg-997]QKF07955.1 YraN family protein [Berryella wangjianweii]